MTAGGDTDDRPSAAAESASFDQSPAPARVPDLVHRRRWATLVVLCISLAIIGLDTTVLNVALPTLQRELDATAGQLQWIIDAYTVAFAGLLLLAGAAGDKYGRKLA